MLQTGEDSTVIQLNNLSDSSEKVSIQDPSVSNDTSNTKLLFSLRKPCRVDISFNDIRYSVNSWTKQDKGLPVKRERKEVLKGISGTFQSHELTGIIGQSGCGKTSLLDILSGFSGNFSGQVLYNECPSDLQKLRKQAVYVMQDYTLQPLLTVKEAMFISAQLKLGTQYTKKQILAIVTDILTTFELTQKIEYMISTLSGGEKKRLAIALEVVNNPPVMFFDEPTSGLDYHIAKKCLQHLKDLAGAGHNIVCTLHQPSASMFEQLDHVYVISKGHCVYQGTSKGLTVFLEDLGLACPKYHNLADYVLDLSMGEYGPWIDRLVEKIDNGKSTEWRRTALQVNDLKDTELFSKKKENLHHTIPFSTQFAALLLRTFTLIHREKFLTLFRILIHCGVAVVFGLCYYNVGNDAAYAIDNFRLLFFSIMFLMFTALSSMIVSYPLEMPVIVREHFNHWYSLKSYYLAVTVAHTPVQLLCTLAYCIIIYLITNQPLELFRFGLFMSMLMAVTLFTQALGILIGAVFNVEHGVIIGPIAVFPWLIFSGFFLKLSDAPVFLQWLFHISFLKYAIEGLMLAIYGYGRDKLPCDDDYCHFRMPTKFLKEMDMNQADYGLSLSFILGLYLAVKVMTYFVLRYQLSHRSMWR